MARRLRQGFVKGAWALAIWLLSIETSLASPQDLFGFGPESMSMGGTGAAMSSGFGAVHANPALLSKTRELSLTLGLQAARFSLFAESPREALPLYSEPLKGVIIGAAVPIPFGGALEDRVSLGAGFFTPTDVIVRARLLNPERPEFSLLADRAQSVAIQAGFGADVGYGLRLGAGFTALAGIVGSVHVATQASGQIGTQIENQLIATYAPTLGAASALPEDFHLGLTYRGKLEGPLEVVIHVHDLGSLVVPPLNIAGMAQYDPEQLQAELGRKIGKLTVATGITWKRWSRYRGALEPTVICPDELPDCGALLPEEAGFRDTWAPRLGIAYEVPINESALARFRGGAFYEMSPAPEQRGEANDFDNDRLALTFGYGLSLSGPWPPIDLDIVFQRHFLIARTHEKAASVDSSRPGSPSVRAGGAITMAALMTGVRF